MSQPISLKNIWVKVAANPGMLKAGGDFHWRCFIGDSREEISLKHCVVTGEGTGENTLFESDLVEEIGPKAWINYFCHLTIRDDVATLELQTPPSKS